MKDDFKNRDYLRQQDATARELRRRTGFAGISGPLVDCQEKMMLDFRKSSAIKHAGDKGTVREGVLRDFLVKERYLPQRFAVSEGSSHIVATSGATSGQMDLVIYDVFNAPRLLTMNSVQYFPVEAVYGVISVKSNLDSTNTIQDGLGNVASFKSLQPVNAAPAIRLRGETTRGFGVLFAYEASLKWQTLCETIKTWQVANSPAVWPNLVVILDQGLLVQLTPKSKGRQQSVISSEDISALTEPELMGMPGDDYTLLHFYLTLMDLLTPIRLPPVPMRRYTQLPRYFEGHSIEFPWGSFVEVRTCAKHGEYLFNFAIGAADKIIAACAAEGLRDGGEIHDVSPPGSEGPVISGVTGTQGPTR